MILTLNRLNRVADATLGELLIDGQRECYTLEDRVRAAGIKVPRETAIPSGSYRVVLTMSHRFGCVLPLLADVPGFSGIRIHPGNTTGDTEGCILVGEEIEGDRLLRSRSAFTRLFEKLQDAESRGETIVIDIVDAWRTA